MTTAERIRAWHTSEQARLRALHARTGDRLALSKARWHAEALQMLDLWERA